MGIWDDLRSVAVRFMSRRSSHTSTGSTPAPKAVLESTNDPDCRETISRVLTGLGKFAVDSAVNEPIKGVSGGMQVYKIVKEGLKDQAPLEPAYRNKKPRHTVMMEEMQARMEKLEDLDFLRLDSEEESILCSKDFDPRKEEESAEPNDKSAPLKTDVKKVFIRSRL